MVGFFLLFGLVSNVARRLLGVYRLSEWGSLLDCRVGIRTACGNLVPRTSRCVFLAGYPLPEKCAAATDSREGNAPFRGSNDARVLDSLIPKVRFSQVSL